MPRVPASFRPEVIRLKLKDLQLSKVLIPQEKKHAKYRQIEASLAIVGLIEPIVVFPVAHGFRVLDGHKRIEILRDRNVEEVECIIGTTDDAYTYNRRVNYLSTIGEHQMIIRALRHNSEDTIAQALNLDVSTIRKKRTLLTGICREAVDVLKDRPVSPKAFAALRQMKPVRQVAAAQLMIASNMYSDRFAQALLAGTSEEMLARPVRSSKSRILSRDQRTRLIAETDSLLENVKTVEARYGEDALTLSVCCRYLERLLANGAIAEYLAMHHRGILDELNSLVQLFREESAVNSESDPVQSKPSVAGR